MNPSLQNILSNTFTVLFSISFLLLVSVTHLISHFKDSNDTITALTNNEYFVNNKFHDNARIDYYNDKNSKNDGKKVKIIKLDSKTYEAKNGRLKETNSYNRVNKIEISFTIDENLESRIETKKFYIQIRDDSDMLVGVSQNAFVGGKQLNYNFDTEVEYKKLEINTTNLFEFNETNFKKGVYFISIFNNRGELLISKSFDLN